MFLTYELLRKHLAQTIANKREQGHVCDGLHDELRAIPNSYDALNAFAKKLAHLPLRADWPYVEPDDWAGIQAQMHPERPRGQWREISLIEAKKRVETAFLSSVCGCILGKPIEVMPTLDTLEKAFEPLGEWPLRDYISRPMLDALGDRHSSWASTTRGHIRFVEPDDDMNYTLLGMLLLEKAGLDFSRADVCELWGHHLVFDTTWGPERTTLAKVGLQSLTYAPEKSPEVFEEWVELWNPGDELCGAQIRADAYGYACPGNPELAAELAWRDAGFTHRRTGVYATMWTAAAIACAFVARDPLEIFEVANGFVPQNSRFARIVKDSLKKVRGSKSWREGYEAIHGKYKEFGHCQVYQESGTLINTLFHAPDIGDGFCIQVMQGNDTDSYGATAGSILGAYFGPGHLDARWLEPFGDEVHTGLAWFYDQSLSKLARRVAALPELTLDRQRRF